MRECFLRRAIPLTLAGSVVTQGPRYLGVARVLVKVESPASHLHRYTQRDGPWAESLQDVISAGLDYLWTATPDTARPTSHPVKPICL